MNLGQIDPENENFLNNYKKFGFATKTEMANAAFRTFRQLKARELRSLWRQEAFSEIDKSKRDHAFEELDGEDFVQGR